MSRLDRPPTSRRSAVTASKSSRASPFAHALAAKVTDSRRHPIAGAPVIFKVTSGTATFARANLHLAAAAVIGGAQALLKRANPRRDAVTEPTNAHGVATAPALAAGPKAAPIIVTASVGVSGKVKAVFHTSMVSRRRH